MEVAETTRLRHVGKYLLANNRRKNAFLCLACENIMIHHLVRVIFQCCCVLAVLYLDRLWSQGEVIAPAFLLLWFLYNVIAYCR